MNKHRRNVIEFSINNFLLSFDIVPSYHIACSLLPAFLQALSLLLFFCAWLSSDSWYQLGHISHNCLCCYTTKENTLLEINTLILQIGLFFWIAKFYYGSRQWIYESSPYCIIYMHILYSFIAPALGIVSLVMDTLTSIMFVWSHKRPSNQTQSASANHRCYYIHTYQSTWHIDTVHYCTWIAKGNYIAVSEDCKEYIWDFHSTNLFCKWVSLIYPEIDGDQDGPQW